MTQARQPAPAAPTTPQGGQGAPVAVAPATPVPNIVTPQLLTSRDVRALRSRVSEMADQLKAATSRRTQVQNSLRGAVGADKAGLEQRLGVLDQRIARIESDIDEAGRQLSSIEAQKAMTVGDPGSGGGRGSRTAENMVPVAICIVLFVLSPIAIARARAIWKRTGDPRQATNPENTERMVRMEQAIDSIAIEIERVSEGQRFVTRLLAEGKMPAQVGGAQPVAEGVRAGENFGGKR